MPTEYETLIQKNRERAEQHKAERKSHQNQLEEKYGVSGNLKAQKLYELAWEYGHSDGWDEIESYYSDMVELITNE